MKWIRSRLAALQGIDLDRREELRKRIRGNLPKEEADELMTHINSKARNSLYLGLKLSLFFLVIAALTGWAAVGMKGLQPKDVVELVKAAVAICVALVLFSKPSLPGIDIRDVEDCTGIGMSLDMNSAANEFVRQGVQHTERYFLLISAIVIYATVILSLGQ